MNLDQANKILDYGTVPKKRAEQVQLIQLMGYKKLKGGNLPIDSPDRQRQVYRVAQRLFRKAEEVMHGELHAQLKEINDEKDLQRYHLFLCDRFNIPEAERENYTIRELEEQLMQ